MKKNWRERIYFWFRPQMEKDLFGLLKIVSEDTDMTLGTVLHGFVPRHENTCSILFKPAVDAFFYKRVGFFDAADTAVVEMYSSSAGRTGKIVKTDISVRRYVKKLARRLSEAGIHTVKPGDLSVWREEWQHAQQLGKKICYFMAARYELKDFEMYEYGFPRFERRVIEQVLRELSVEFRRDEDDSPKLKNMASLTAYYLFLVI